MASGRSPGACVSAGGGWRRDVFGLAGCGPAGEQPEPVVGRGSRLSGVSGQGEALVSLQGHGLEQEVEGPDGGVAEALAAAAVEPDVVVGPHGAELLAAGAQLADQGGEGSVERVAACLGAQQLDGGPGRFGEVGVEVAGGGVEEPEARKVDIPAGDGEGWRVQGAAEGVGGEDVEAAVADE